MSEAPSIAATAQPLAPGLRFKLSVMMLLQYAIWGAWLPILWPFLAGTRGFKAEQIGNMFAVGAIGAIVAPFVAGQIADRWFNTERYLAISHILGGILVWQLAHLETYTSFLYFSLFYSLIYSPTLPLTNSLAFHHLPDRDRDFGRVRIWGTVGWILVGIGVGQWLYYKHTPEGLPEVVQAAQDAGRADAFRLSGILGIVLGVFCLFLPKTPPQRNTSENAIGAALSSIRKQPLIVLFLLAVPISCIHQFYFVHTAGFLSVHQNVGDVAATLNKVFGVGGGGLMTIGQIAEIAVLALLPLVAKSVSRKGLLGLGILAYGLRMFLFAYVDSIGLPAVLTLILGVSLHGVCFGCFIFVAFMVVDEECSEDVKASGQSLFNLVIVGIGTIVGSKLAAKAVTWATVDDQLDYRQLFSYPMWASVACLVALLLFYRGGRRQPAG